MLGITAQGLKGQYLEHGIQPGASVADTVQVVYMLLLAFLLGLKLLQSGPAGFSGSVSKASLMLLFCYVHSPRPLINSLIAKLGENAKCHIVM